MIIKANLERKPSTLKTDACNIVGVEQVSLEEFLALKTSRWMTIRSFRNGRMRWEPVRRVSKTVS